MMQHLILMHLPHKMAATKNTGDVNVPPGKTPNKDASSSSRSQKLLLLLLSEMYAEKKTGKIELHQIVYDPNTKELYYTKGVDDDDT